VSRKAWARGWTERKPEEAEEEEEEGEGPEDDEKAEIGESCQRHLGSD